MVGKIKGKRYNNEYRPFEHDYCQGTSAYCFSGSARLFRVIPPADVYENGYLSCKECSFSVLFSEKTSVMSGRKQGAAADKYIKHKCKV